MMAETCRRQVPQRAEPRKPYAQQATQWDLRMPDLAATWKLLVYLRLL